MSIVVYIVFTYSTICRIFIRMIKILIQNCALERKMGVNKIRISIPLKYKCTFHIIQNERTFALK